MKNSHENPAFIGDIGHGSTSGDERRTSSTPSNETEETFTKSTTERDTWGKGVEFLMSCIAMSVGLGNVWRFPFTALDNGGGAFLIPYLIVLFFVGKPLYYLEMILGQFSSRGPVKVYDLCPAMRGIGLGQAFMVFMLGTYYQSICAIISYYLVESFRDPLPWSYCRPEWGSNCIDSAPQYRQVANGTGSAMQANNTQLMMNTGNRTISSSEWYFVKEVLRERNNISDGIGLPNWELVLGLFVSWVCVFFIIRKGVKSSGKFAYFLALFPYAIMVVLLVRAVSLPGAGNGILYFIKPNWGKLLDPKVWYAAVTQCFYSLAVCFGNIIMYASFNSFDQNIYRDATIVTSLDTCTSLLAGFTIFGILGNLAHEMGTEDIGSVVKPGAGLAFISYPDAIAKFPKLPQIFSVLFFLMLFVLGIGSNVAMTSCTVTSIRDYFPQWKAWQCTLAIAIVSFVIGLSYVTPGGQFMLTLVDYFGASMIALILGIAELYVLGWAYGVKRLCKDAEFMMPQRKVGLYWRWCWALITPLIMTLILLYFLATYEVLTYNDVTFPTWAYAVGWTITCLGVLQLPIFTIVAIVRCPGKTLSDKVQTAFKPKHDWGPSDALLREQYKNEIQNEAKLQENLGCWSYIKRNIFD